jgi:arylsulfatase
VLYARGSHNGGHAFFVRDGALHFDYNALGTHHRASGPVSLDPGDHTLSARFERSGPGGTITIAADGLDVGAVELPKVLRMLASTGTDFGKDTLSPVVDDYEAPFPFAGNFRRVVFEILSRPDARDVVVTARTEMAKE